MDFEIQRDLARASSGTIEKKFHGGSTGGYYIGIDWRVKSQDKATNTSTVHATAYIRASGSGYTINSSAKKNITLTVNGTQFTGTSLVGLSAGQKRVLLNNENIPVKHNSDGTKTCTFAMSATVGLTLSGTYYGTISHSGSATFDKINLNTAPWWTSDDTRMNDIRAHVIIPENWNAVTVTSATANDSEQGGNLHYDLHRYINGNYSAQIKSGGSGLSVTDYIGSWGQGTRIKYRANAHDGSLWTGSDRWSWEYTKNTFTRASVDSIGSIGVGTTTVGFRAHGIRNSGGGNGYVSNNFGYRIESLTSGVTIGGTATHSQGNADAINFILGVKNNGGNPTNPHWLDANELKNVLRNSNYCGNIKLRLVSWNDYGSQGSYDFNIWVDLRQNPDWTTITYDANNAITHGGTSYYIPAYLPFKFSWNAVKDPVEGNACTYEVGYQIGEGSYVWLGTTSSTTYTAYLGSTAIGNTKQNNFRIIVRAKTRYGNYSDSGGARVTLWDYSPPSVRIASTERKKGSVVTKGTITVNSSIPNITLKQIHWRWNGSSNTFFEPDTTNQRVNNFTITANVNDDFAGTMHVASSDSVRDLIEAKVSIHWDSAETTVKGYMPVMSLTKYGLGVGTRLENSSYKFVVDGNANILGRFYLNGSELSNTNILSRGTVTCETGTNRPALNGVSMQQAYNNGYPTTYGNVLTLKGGGDGQLLIGWSGTSGAHAPVYVRSKRDTSDASWSGWAQIYTTVNKPSAADIGAAASSHAHHQGDLTQENYNHDDLNWIMGQSSWGSGRKFRSGQASGGSPQDSVYAWGAYLQFGGDSSTTQIYTPDRRSANEMYFRNTWGGQGAQNWNRVWHSGNISPIANWGTGNRITLSDWYYSTGNTGWYNSTYGGGWYMTDSTWVRSYSDKSIYTGATVKSWVQETRYLRPEGSNNMDLTVNGGSMYFSTSASSGCALYLNRNWSGNNGSEPSFYNTKGNGWGFLGNSGTSFFRVYGSGGSVSDRNKKYEITKADIETQYENVRCLNIYNYRTVSTLDVPIEEMAENFLKDRMEFYSNEFDRTLSTESVTVDDIVYDALDENLTQEEIKELRIKEIAKKNSNLGECHRQDLSLGCMIDEMPLETTFYDNEGGDGKAVDIYSYITMILGATKHLIDKVETLELENEELKDKLDRMEELLNGVINKG